MEENQAKLIEGLKKGDKKVFHEIFDTYYEPLCRYCMLRIPSQEDAEEIVQDIFVKLWAKRHELGINLSLRAYLYRSALNKIINYGDHRKIRQIHQEHVLLHNNSANDAANPLLEHEIQVLAAQAVDAMPEKRREVYLLSRQQGLKYNEIAEKLGVSVKTVEAHLSKALEQLRLHLKDYLPMLLMLTAPFLG